MESFSQFASDLDPITQRLLARGARLTELLKQDQFSPLPVEEQVVSIFAGVRGYLDDIQVSDVGRFETTLLELIRTKHDNVLAAIRDSGEISDETEKELREITVSFVDSFV
jgi:F-type H+-transporting ATPase subunit alpha